MDFEAVFDRELSDCCVDKGRFQAIDRCKRFENVVLIVLQRSDEGVSVAPCCSGNVENITRLDAGASIMNLLGNDLGDCFDLFLLDRSPRRWLRRHGMSNNEIDFASTVERKLEKAGSVDLIVGRSNLKFKVV